MAKQQQLDDRYEKRRRRGGLFDLVVDVVATWDPAHYIAKQRKVVQDILALPRNARRRKFNGLSTKEHRHQVAIRMVHALLDGLSQAQYCRRHKLDQATTSRMLAHLYENELGLQNAIGAISACAAMTSWQNRQQQRKFRNRVRLILGWNFDDIADNLTEYSAGSVRSIYGGHFKSMAFLHDDEPFIPLDLHEPSTWHDLVDSYPDWGALSEPVRDVKRFETLPDRYRPIRRKVRLKNGKRQTLDIARALDGSAASLVYWERHAWPETMDSFDRIRRLADDPSFKDNKASILGLVPIESRREVRAELPVVVRRLSSKPPPLCNSPRPIPLPPVRAPHGIISPFTRWPWMPWPVKDTPVLAKQVFALRDPERTAEAPLARKGLLRTPIPECATLYFVRIVTSTGEPQQCLKI